MEQDRNFMIVPLALLLLFGLALLLASTSGQQGAAPIAEKAGDRSERTSPGEWQNAAQPNSREPYPNATPDNTPYPVQPQPWYAPPLTAGPPAPALPGDEDAPADEDPVEYDNALDEEGNPIIDATEEGMESAGIPSDD